VSKDEFMILVEFLKDLRSYCGNWDVPVAV